MTDIKRSITVPFSSMQMFDLVKNLASYPEFLSWCKASRVQNQTPYKIQATLEASKFGMDFTFSILYQLEANQLIKIFLLNKGPFRTIDAFWRFRSIDNHQSQLTFELHYQLSSAFLSWTLTPLIKNEVNHVLKEISQRARKIFDVGT